jgi:hypothetical protein
MGGDNSPANIVALTPEEHYVAHQLLVKMYPTVKGLATAVLRMARQCSGNKAYGWLRRRLSSLTRGVPRRRDLVERSAAALRGRKRPPFSAEMRAKMSAAKLGKPGKPLSAEHLAKLMAGRKRAKPHVLTPEQRQRLSMAQRRRGGDPPEVRAKKVAAAKAREPAKARYYLERALREATGISFVGRLRKPYQVRICGTRLGQYATHAEAAT